MAEGYLRHFAAGRAEVFSAGVETHGVNPRAIAVMKEDGLDISGHTSNHVDTYSHIPFDIIITVCDSARERCPVLPSRAAKFHHDFPDPARATGSEEEIMQAFRYTRDLVRDYCRQFIAAHV